MWKLTGKKGLKARFFHFFHRVFNKWKVKRPFYSLYSPILWKTFLQEFSPNRAAALRVY